MKEELAHPESADGVVVDAEDAPPKIEVSAVSWSERWALLNDGSTVPVTNLFRDDGEETDDPAEAFTFVCGAGDRWLCGLVEDYESAVMQ